MLSASSCAQRGPRSLASREAQRHRCRARRLSQLRSRAQPSPRVPVGRQPRRGPHDERRRGAAMALLSTGGDGRSPTSRPRSVSRPSATPPSTKNRFLSLGGSQGSVSGTACGTLVMGSMASRYPEAFLHNPPRRLQWRVRTTESDYLAISSSAHATTIATKSKGTPPRMNAIGERVSVGLLSSRDRTSVRTRHAYREGCGAGRSQTASQRSQTA